MNVLMRETKAKSVNGLDSKKVKTKVEVLVEETVPVFMEMSKKW